MEKTEDKQTWRQKLLFYTTAFFVLLGTFSLFSFLFLVPFVIDPAFTTIFMEFDENPAFCVTVRIDRRLGASNCSWTSCREGCTKDIYDCTQIRVNYKLVSNMSNTSNLATVTPSPIINLDLTDYEYEDEPMPGLQGNNSEWYFREARLFPNVKGCGYPPMLNCSVFLKTYVGIGTNFSCYYSKVDPGLVISHLDMWQVYMNLVYAMCIPIPSFIVSVIYLAIAYFKIYNDDEEAAPLEKNAEEIDVEGDSAHGETPIPPASGGLTPASEAFREDLASFGHHFKVAMVDDISRDSLVDGVTSSVSIGGVTYSCESWTTYRRHLKALEKYHQRCLRRILGIKWQDRQTNISVLEKADSTSIEAMIVRQQLLIKFLKSSVNDMRMQHSIERRENASMGQRGYNSRFMTVGSVRYGMRVGAVSPPPPGAGPRYRTHCCWPITPCSDFSNSDNNFSISRIPLLTTPPINSLDIISCANRMRMNDDATSTSEQTLAQQSTRDHVLYTGKCLLKTQIKRCALVRPQVYTRLTEYGEINGNKEDNTLDRLPRFRFGGNRAERLKRGAVPIPPPRTRHQSRTTPPVSPQPVLTTPESDESTSRVTPLRSASFSQVDYCSDDNKYVRRKPADEKKQPESNFAITTLPRSKTVSRACVNSDTSVGKQDKILNRGLLETPLNKAIPEVEITPESPEKSPDKTPVRVQDNIRNNLDKRRDKSRRRKGIYLPRWPSAYNSSEDVESECFGSLDKNTPESFQWSSPQEEPVSPDDNNSPPEWPLRAINRRFHSQSPDERDYLKVSKALGPFRTDSLSEGEPEFLERKADQLSLVPSDISDNESRLSIGADPTSPNIPRRYSKRPLRGPYGQMLEAEMKKPESRKNLNTDLKFLEDLPALTSSSMNNLNLRSRGSCNSSIDETNKDSVRNIDSPKPQLVHKRKVSVDNLVIENNQKLVPNHQRTTSSPSKLEVLANTEVSSVLLEQLLRGSSEQLATNDVNQQQQNDTRTHVLIELYDNERIYVESLQIICNNYWEPLKKAENQCLLETHLVEEIFSQIPFLLVHHQKFLQQLKTRLELWDAKQIIGDVFLEMFSQTDVIENYTTYVNNWKRSRDILKNAQQSKPSFNRFLEVTARQHAGKLALDSLLIKPIQKFPKYELLLQRLIKHTNETHPDYELLIEAQKQVHEHLLKINCTEREALDMEQLREIENLIEGALDLASPERQYIRHDMVVMSHSASPRKERALFLFSDLLLITGIKRRSGTINKKTTATNATTNTNLEANKYKLMMKVPLEDVEIIRSKDDNLRQMQIEVDNLNEDIAVLNQINELSWTLHCSHLQLDEVVKDMLTSLNKQLNEQQNSDLQLSVVDLTVQTQNGIENVSIVFPKAETRTSWEESFTEAKARLGERLPCPEMMATVPIRKTRAGLQFTCAAPTLSENGKDVWVCNSDGYVGQVCVLTLGEKPEPTVTSCNGVCNTRILCIASVPGPGLNNRSSQASNASSRTKDKMHQPKVMQFDSSSSSDENDTEDDHQKNADSESGSTYNEEPDKLSTMWLGTEDGCIHIYNSNDNIRIKKNKIKLQLGSAIVCIIYLENRVFASQANGNMLIYDRDSKSGWNTSNPKTINVGNTNTPVSKMVVFNSKIFCACGNTVILLNPHTLVEENSFTVTTDTNKPISCILICGTSIWLSLQNSAIIKCFHALTFEFLCETNVAPAVTKMLTSCDDIIRQHKAACLRVTALVHCKDLLWIGTSAGVLLTMPLPHISSTTTRLSNVPTVTGVPHGHTGHVRILTSVEMPYITTKKGTPLKKLSKSKNTEQTSKQIKHLVISGGDGYEDFRTSNLSEVAGREDSTNHLLLWNI